MRGGRSVVEGDEIPYQPWAAAKKLENWSKRLTDDPLAKCYMPGVPRIMYMEFPFHIFQARDHIAITFEGRRFFGSSTPTEPPALTASHSGWAIHADVGRATRSWLT
jgi:hypothetical protein